MTKADVLFKLSNIGHYYGTRHALRHHFDNLVKNNYSTKWEENARRNSTFCSFNHKGPKLRNMKFGFFFVPCNFPSMPTEHWIQQSILL